MPIPLAVLDQLKYFLDRVHQNFICSFNDKLLWFALVDLQWIVADALLVMLKKVVNLLVVYLNVWKLYLERFLVLLPVIRVFHQIYLVKEVLHWEYQDSRILIRIVQVTRNRNLAFSEWALHAGAHDGASPLIAHHSISLPCTSLSVNEHSAV